MRILMLSLAVALGLGSASAARAQTLDLSWDQCSPVINDRDIEPKDVAAFYATVIGHSEVPTLYEVWWFIGDSSDGLPDAWRFDEGGCQPDGQYLFRSFALNALAKACPPLVPFGHSRQEISRFQLAQPDMGIPLNAGNGFLSVAPAPGAASPDPTKRYMLASFQFDFAFGVEGPSTPGEVCGGLEETMIVRLMPWRTFWRDSNGVEHAWTIGNSMLRVGEPFVPAHVVTWGLLKGQYRH